MNDTTHTDWYQAVYDRDDDGANPFARQSLIRQVAPVRVYDVLPALDRALAPIIASQSRRAA